MVPIEYSPLTANPTITGLVSTGHERSKKKKEREKKKGKEKKRKRKKKEKRERKGREKCSTSIDTGMNYLAPEKITLTCAATTRCTKK